jgi:hypothetical protein
MVREPRGFRQRPDISKIYLNNYSTMNEFMNDYVPCRNLLLKRLREPAPGRIQLLTGPRQVGKTTLLLEIAAQFGDAAVYAAGDEPDAALPGFWERRRAEAEARARRTQPFSCWMRFITWMTGQSTSKGIGTTCAGKVFQSTSSPQAPRHCG